MRQSLKPNAGLYEAAPQIHSLGVDLGLLLLRVWFGGALLLKHGLEKPIHFSQMAAHFPDPVHIGPVPSLVIALVSDFVCTILVVLGLATRWASLFIFANVLVAWVFVHHLEFFGKSADHGELTVLYIGAFLALALTGPGRFSLDAQLFPLHRANRRDL